MVVVAKETLAAAALRNTHLRVPSWIPVNKTRLFLGVQAPSEHAVQQRGVHFHLRVVPVHVAQHHPHLARSVVPVPRCFV